MKHHLSSIIVNLLFLAAMFSGERSYKKARHIIVSDLNQALSSTLASSRDDIITPDTVALMRDNLTLPVLKDSTYIAYCLPGDKPKGICSDIMHLEDATIRGYADVSMASVLGLADKRLPAAFSLMAVLCLIGSAMLTRRKQMKPALQLTPMQRQLLDIFKEAPEGELSKEEICRTLWPGKPMTDDAMYSLIRHLKTSLEDSGYEIETRRGFGYRLKKR